MGPPSRHDGLCRERGSTMAIEWRESPYRGKVREPLAVLISDPVSLDTSLTNHGDDQGGGDGEEGTEASDSARRGAGGQRGRGAPGAVERAAEDGGGAPPA